MIKLKKILSLILALTVVICALPFGVMAEDEEIVYYKSGVYTYTVTDGEATITDCDTSFLGKKTIPDNLGGYPVTSIGGSAFYNCSLLTAITIPNNVVSIGSYAFEDCTSLTSITFGNGVESIGSNAFSYCNSLNKVNITNLDAWCNINFSNFSSNPLEYAKNLYINGTLATDIIIPDSVTTIKSHAFYNCDSLSSIVIPDNVSNIGNFAFAACDSLSSIKLGNGITALSNSLFSYSTSLTSITIPDSVTSIGESTFKSCTSLTSIAIPDSVTSIDYNAFSRCNSLSEVKITDLAAWCKIEFFDYESNPLFFAKNLNINGKHTTNMVIPDSVTRIKQYTFNSFTTLSKLTIPGSVEKIDNYAFDGCTSIETVFYLGSSSKWNKINGNNSGITSKADIYYHNYHQFGDWVVEFEPTCTEMGGKYHTCIVCGECEKELMLPTGIHNYKNGECIHCGEAQEFLPNDINGDGEINSADVVLLKKALLDKTEISSDNNVYDINGDGELNILDFISLKKTIAE